MRETFLIASLFLLLICSSVSAQEVEMINKHATIDIEIISGRPSIRETVYESTLFQGDFNGYTSGAVYYSDISSLLYLNAYTLLPKGNDKFKKVTSKVYEIKDIVEPGIFYGGHKKKEFVFPSVVDGAIGVLEYERKINDAHIISPFYFSDRVRVKESSFTVSYPESVKIKTNLFNVDSSSITEKHELVEGRHFITWTMKNVDKRKYNELAPSSSKVSPHIILRLASYETGGKKINVSSSTDDLFWWYNTLIGQMPSNGDPQKLADKVAELTSSDKTREENIETIYDWVQSNIKYIAFEDGMAGFIPRAAPDVFQKRYGDCKDMANLLTTMLQAAEIPAYLVWIGTNAKPYSYHEVPCTVADNHMISAVKQGNDYIFLDPTNSYLEYGASPRAVQGKEALIRLDNSSYDIVKVPESNPDYSTRHDQMELTLDKNNLVGSVKSEVSGYEKEAYFYAQLSKKYNNETNFLQNFLSIGKMSSVYQQPVINEREQKVVLSFDGVFKNDVIEAGGKLYVNLHLDPSVEEHKINDMDNREVAIEKPFKHTYRLTAKLEVPEGYKVEYMPENEQVNFDFGQVKVTYTNANGMISLTKEIVSDFLTLEKSEFGNYQQFYDQILNIAQQKIVLKKL